MALIVANPITSNELRNDAGKLQRNNYRNLAGMAEGQVGASHHSTTV